MLVWALKWLMNTTSLHEVIDVEKEGDHPRQSSKKDFTGFNTPRNVGIFLGPWKNMVLMYNHV